MLLPSARALYEGDGPTYGRAGLGTQAELAEAVAALEGAAAVSLFPSGLAAVVGGVLSVVQAGDHVLFADGVYAPTRRFLTETLRRFGVTADPFDPAAAPVDVLAQARPDTRLLVLESPASLTFEMLDVPAFAAAARERGVLTLIDNTWAAGALFRPLQHGVDLSVQALTKYASGHADVFGGSVAVNDPKLQAALNQTIWDMGWATSPDDAWLILRGLRTLDVRLARHAETTAIVAERLQRRPEVKRLRSPALPGDPGHALWRRDYSGANGLLGVELIPGPKRAVYALLDALRVFGLGFSWGGFESLAIWCDPQLGKRTFPPALAGPLLRLHVGLEPVETLVADLDRALDAYAAALESPA